MTFANISSSQLWTVPQMSAKWKIQIFFPFTTCIYQFTIFLVKAELVFFQKVKGNVLEKFSKHFAWWKPSLFWHLLQTMLFINIGSKVIPQSRTDVNNTGMTQRTHRKLSWMSWVHVLFNFGIITLTTTIDTSYWNFKKVILYTTQSFRHPKVY